MSAGQELLGRIALVTGAARGIGRAVVEELAKAGAEVIGVDVLPPPGCATGEQSSRIHFQLLDVSDFIAVQEAFRQVEKDYGGLHILVNNAGVTDDQVLGRMKPEQWRRVIEINLGGCFNCCRAAARIMVRQRSGRIINISSIVARAGRAGQTNYAASKAGIEGLTRSLALELAHRGITVNAVAPGYIDTEMTRSLPEAVREEILPRIPLGRPGTAEEVASLVCFLAGPDAAYITGQTIGVNGGLFFG